MGNTYTATEDTWFIVNGGEFHHGQLKSGSTLATKFEILTYSTKSEWVVALKDLKVPPPIPKIVRPTNKI